VSVICCTLGVERTAPGLTLTSDERDELAHALLHAFFGFFGDFGIFRESELHDSGNFETRKLARA
jgi:hypothetical protein